MTKHHKLFTALIVQGALLGGCFDEEEGDATDDASASDTDANTDTDTDTSTDTDVTTDTADCSTAVCEDTDDWQLCTGDGVLCCWATGECCNTCCGHLSAQ